MVRIPKRLLLALAALLILVLAVWGGLLRAQWKWPVPQANWISFHGPLMISGFFGTIISLARANRLPSDLPLLIPLCTALGAFLLLLGGSQETGAGMFFLASLGYLFISTWLFRRRASLGAGLALLGGCGWVWANGLWWWGIPIPHLVLGWQLLFILTLASEREDWNGGSIPLIFGVAAALLLGGTALEPFHPGLGIRFVGAGEILLAGRFLARRVRWREPEPVDWRGYTRACLIGGDLWLALGGFIALILGPDDSGLPYDAFLHCIFLGFVFSMVFSHAPLLLPRVLKAPIPFHGAFYSHWAILQASLAVRVLGDLASSSTARRWAGVFNALALFLFTLNTALAVHHARRGGLRST